MILGRLFDAFRIAGGKAVDPYLGLLYAMDDVAVYGYITAFKVKIVVALALSDTIIKDVDMVTVCFTIIIPCDAP
jgi:hypothetical protein